MAKGALTHPYLEAYHHHHKPVPLPIDPEFFKFVLR